MRATWRPSGLRLRISTAITAVVLVTVSGLGIAVHLLVVEDHIAQQRATVDQDLVAATTIYTSTGQLTFDARFDDPALPDDLARAVSGEGSRATYVSGRGQRQLWAAGRTDGRVLSIHTTIPSVDASVASVDQALVASGLVTVFAASGLGVLIAGQLSRRLRLAARSARAVARGEKDVSLRSAVGPRRDEVGDLADAVDAMTDRLDAQLRAEQRLTADVAHDLRTPLAGLLVASSLLDDSRPAILVRDRVNALTALVEDLLEIGRLDQGLETAELEHIHLGEVVARIVQRGIASGEVDAGAIRVVQLPPEARLLTDPRRLERVLSNLVRNALAHGRPPVEVRVSGGEVVISDSGNGFPARLLLEGPRRFESGTADRSRGRGLGLPIALGQAAVLGAELTLSNGPHGGGQARLRLPGAELPEPAARSVEVVVGPESWDWHR